MSTKIPGFSVIESEETLSNPWLVFAAGVFFLIFLCCLFSPEQKISYFPLALVKKLQIEDTLKLKIWDFLKAKAVVSFSAQRHYFRAQTYAYFLFSCGLLTIYLGFAASSFFVFLQH